MLEASLDKYSDSTPLEEVIELARLVLNAFMPAAGAASAIMTMPRYVNVIRQDSGTRASPERQAQEGGTSPDRAQVQSNAPQPATRQNSGKGIDSLWQLMTAHNCGRCQLWDISRGQLQPIAVLGTQTHPAKYGTPTLCPSLVLLFSHCHVIILVDIIIQHVVQS